MVTMAGSIIQTILDSTENPNSNLFDSNKKYYDIIGFDPRGVENSTPSSSCFPDDVSVGAWDLQATAQGYPHSNESFVASWSRHISLGRSCTWRMGDEENEGLGIGRYLSTPNVVEDMVAIIEALGKWREMEYTNLRSSRQFISRNDIPEQIRWKKGEEKLLYWGFSYGTLLGSTFAAMYPKRVGRLALDGVVDAEDYYSGEYSFNSRRLALMTLF
jgi:pimeloyl-ACP methyl ester carboxylesterase